MRRLLFLLLLPLLGCYDIMLVNVGSSAKTSASAGQPQPPEVECQALATPKITSPVASIDAVQTCLHAVEEQKIIDKAKHK